MKPYLLIASLLTSGHVVAGAEYLQTSELLCQAFQEGDYICVTRQAVVDNATDVVILSSKDLLALGATSFTPKVPLNLAMK